MATITWLGAPGEDTKVNLWKGISFEKDKAVEVKDEQMLKIAATNPHFKVAGYTLPKEEPPKVTPHGEPVPDKNTIFKPPSDTFSPQHPVPKAGEPVYPEERERPPPPEPEGGEGEGEGEGEGGTPLARKPMSMSPPVRPTPMMMPPPPKPKPKV